MALRTHYYVLALGSAKNNLFEAFRDSLIDIETHGFPVEVQESASDVTDEKWLREIALTVDRHFGKFYEEEPLKLIVIGEPEMLSAFSSVTKHGDAVIGHIRGDHTMTPVRDLGQIVWPVVQKAISGVVERALADLATSGIRRQAVSGLEAVVRLSRKGIRALLMVEENFHMRGSIARTDGSPAISPDVDIREVIDDAVDAVIEKVLETEGNVIFMPQGSLSERDRIVLLPCEVADSE